MRKKKLPKRIEFPKTLPEFEKQIKHDEGLQEIWFRNVHTKEETMELIRFYCREIGRLGAADNNQSTETINKIINYSNRMRFLARGMK